MPSWSNWSGKQRARPGNIQFVRSEADVAASVSHAARQGHNVRAAGAGHSHAALVPNDGVIIDTSGLAGIITVDRAQQTARIRAGSRIYTLGRPLHDAGLALINQGDIDRQAIAGACATGTHGTGPGLGNLSSAVLSARLVTASGDAVECSATERPELWQAAQLNLGALGIVTELTLQLRPAYKLAEHGWTESYASLMEKLPELIGGSRHFEFFWYPGDDTAMAKTLDETTQEPRYPLDGEGQRLAWSYEVLPNHRPHLHTEMEYSVPAEAGPACLQEIRDLIQRRFPTLRWPVEYRTLAADDVWLSTAYQQPTVTISVHQDINEDDRPYFEACEAIFLEFGGRPHWGKVHYLDGTRMAQLHPCWKQWWTVRDAIDPGGTFLNDHLRALRDS
jgi:FAD/FMN-containing dehydrogenase